MPGMYKDTSGGFRASNPKSAESSSSKKTQTSGAFFRQREQQQAGVRIPNGMGAFFRQGCGTPVHGRPEVGHPMAG